MTAHCSQAGCIQTDLKAYRKFLGRGVTILCGSCAASLQAIGLSLTPIERREVDVKPIVERRRIGRPRWIENLRGRDETFRMSA